jgi:hypothetical protein
MGWARSKHVRNDNILQNFYGKALRRESTGKIYTQLGKTLERTGRYGLDSSGSG